MKKNKRVTLTLSLTKTEVNLILRALPMIGDREVEEEIEFEDRVGPEADLLWTRIRDKAWNVFKGVTK